ncbi:FdhF/YdeP family oxidoreductase [Pusillimonas caeni]|uniref:FdhF/YdeP family oxidoreductase n=1 Tax=Pusillimonas caeni TaxID=1348472 RepID=UPI000E59CE44|nr:FdhF/YdeP family oxidoreductase [Pusillimonas caeni]TFL10000.1 FdhF/YdeP family oxidoreductase [Pusillimonas caeni]
MTKTDRDAGPYAGDHQDKASPYEGSAGGWGSVRALTDIFARTGAATAAATVLPRQNKTGGVACVSCAWAKPADSHTFEFCENGAKATAWEGTSHKIDAGFFADHSVAALRRWSDHQLENKGRLVEPMAWDPESDRYRPIPWEQAFAEIGAHLGRLEPDSVIFYTSGRASLEASYMYQLMARIYGTNNLPDSSNMCHESTSVGLKETIGLGVGSVRLEDFRQTHAIFFFGQNVGSNSPRMLHELQAASERGVPIVTFNPLRERGLELFRNPQRPTQMLGAESTPVSSHYHQLRLGGDIAAVTGLCKALLQRHDVRAGDGSATPVLDTDFIERHTSGFEAFAHYLRDTKWPDIERHSGLTRAALEDAALIYEKADSVLLVYGMGLTQHVGGVDNVRMLVNLALMRGNIGKAGAGICPVRGHSNVQGQRSVGITEKPELAPLDRLEQLYEFQAPRQKGRDTVGVCEGVIDGSVRGFVGLGGNFVRAAPDTQALEAAWPALDLTVHITTTLNRSHLFPGKASYLLPCLGRTEIDEQRNVPQAVSIEDSTSCVHGSRGRKAPADQRLMSEVAIIAHIALAVGRLSHAKVPWLEWTQDYARVRDAIEATYPQRFSRFNDRLWEPGGFPLTNGPRERIWHTDSGRAQFTVPANLTALRPESLDEEGVMQLMTLRSNDQFNTTIYGYEDRFRGVSGTRQVVFMNRADMERLGLAEGDSVALRTAADDGAERRVGELKVVPYDIPEGCCAAYYPECNVLLPVWHHAHASRVPAGKSIPVRVVQQAGAL